ncbi:MAG: SpoIIIAH-like family protein [Firmicutes bacterium]|nr:SpoIIIAH-like family protein [Bacillota bacterium]
MSRKITTIVLLVLALAAVWYAKRFQSDRIDIVSPGKNQVLPGNEENDEEKTNEENKTGEDPQEDENPAAPTAGDPDPESLNLDSFEEFFVEYRLQRDRIRSNEIEMLNKMIDNPNITAEGKKEAEEQLLALLELMEKELMVENMLKAQGYKDAVFFLKDGRVNIVVQAAKLDETQFMQIADMVSIATGVSVEDISIVEHNAP